MNEQDLRLIEQYFRNELNEAECMAFEKRRAEDPVFQAEVVRHSLAMAAIRMHGRDLLKKKLGERPLPEQKRDPFPRRWIFVVLGLGALVFAWWAYTAYTKPAIQPANPPNEIPTPKKEDPLQESTPHSTPQQAPGGHSDPPIAERQADPGNIFATAFEPFKDESLNPSLRGGGDATPYDQFRQLYWDGRYAEALSAFDLLSASVKNSDNILFIKANAMLATGSAAEAAVLLEGIVARKRTAYSAQAGWYLALAYLKSGNLAKSKTLLRQIAGEENAPRQKDAKRLLEQIK